MSSTTFSTPAVPATRFGAARWTLRVDGLFLACVGSLAALQELRGHFLGSGPLAHLWQSPYTIGGFEAHGLAVIVGMLLLAHAGAARRHPWHLCGLAVHTLLGGANLAFWPSFAASGMLPVGIVTTVLHAGFVAAHAVFALRSGPWE